MFWSKNYLIGIHKRTSSTFKLVCCNRTCSARLLIKTSFCKKAVVRNNRRVLDFDPKIDRQVLLDVANWGECYYDCGHFTGLTCRMDHKDDCKQSDTRPTWISRDLSTEVKNKRKTDRHNLASWLLNLLLKPTKNFSSIQGQLMNDFNSILMKQEIILPIMRKVVYNIKQRCPLPTTTFDVPEALLQLCTTTDDQSQPVYEQLTH